MDTIGDLTPRKKSQENNVLLHSFALNSGSASVTEGGPRRDSRLWAGGSRIDDFFAAAMTKGVIVVSIKVTHTFKHM